MGTSTATLPPAWCALLWMVVVRIPVRVTQVIPSRDHPWSCFFYLFLPQEVHWSPPQVVMVSHQVKTIFK